MQLGLLLLAACHGSETIAGPDAPPATSAPAPQLDGATLEKAADGALRVTDVRDVQRDEGRFTRVFDTTCARPGEVVLGVAGRVADGAPRSVVVDVVPAGAKRLVTSPHVQVAVGDRIRVHVGLARGEDPIWNVRTSEEAPAAPFQMGTTSESALACPAAAHLQPYCDLVPRLVRPRIRSSHRLTRHRSAISYGLVVDAGEVGRVVIPPVDLGGLDSGEARRETSVDVEVVAADQPISTTIALADAEPAAEAIALRPGDTLVVPLASVFGALDQVPRGDPLDALGR